MTDKVRIQVAVGIVFNAAGEVLVGQRTVKDHYFQKWEFPGGKIESGETVTDALIREFREEVGIELGESKAFMTIEHDYPDRLVKLHVHTVNQFSGRAKPMEGQAIQWVPIAGLSELDFLQGNQTMIAKLEREFKDPNIS